MKKSVLTTVVVLILTVGYSQRGPINFEPSGQGASWTWATFENATNPIVTIISNPDMSGANTSANVASFSALQAGKPWAGCESSHGSADLGPFVLDTTNSTIKIMVWKTTISDVGIKLISSQGWAQPELKVSNTKINEWEELTFDFSSYPNPPAADGLYDQIAIFPDYTARTQDNLVYFDNITFSSQSGGGSRPKPEVAAPVPNRIDSNVISIFSDSYTDLAGTNFNPNWSQATIVDTTVLIQGNNAIHYSNLNYQGIALDNNENVSSMDSLHVDIWTSNSNALNIYLISPGPVETPSAINVPTSGWLSIDIPLSDFSPVDLSNLFQLKFDGSGEFWMDNLYFFKAADTTSNSTGTKDINMSEVGFLYPNPVVEGDDIRFTSEISKMELLDLNGKLLKAESNSTLRTSGFSKGIYLVKTTSLSGHSTIQKLIIK